MNDFSEYKKLGEPNKIEKSKIWQAAIGLQKVDGLEPSKYLIETAKQNIEGKLSFYQVKEHLNNYYKNISQRDEKNRTEEADKTSTCIAEILAEQTFTFSPAEYITIHGRLFANVDDKIAGKIRNYNISKKEGVLNGESVIYGSADSITATLDYDFSQEKKFEYKGMAKRDIIDHITKFISNVWQIHPFSEGNTRVAAVFVIKYLRTFGFKVENDLFAKHSLYFRNALVRANYSNVALNIYATTEYLDKFFENLLLNGKNILRNRDLQILTMDSAPKKKTVVKTRDRVLELIAQQPNISVAKMGKELGLSAAGARWQIERLKSEGILRRVGARKLGRWEINILCPRYREGIHSERESKSST